ncbi:MAG: hypothetical protein MZV65_13400 [Chromatiales bacterium]|nr:hypothetical protein [Chromatiales bacterium]
MVSGSAVPTAAKIEPVTPSGNLEPLAEVLERVGEGLGTDQDDDQGNEQEADGHDQ